MEEPFELSEKARKILIVPQELVDPTLLQVLAIIIDNEGSDWSDISGVDDVMTHVLGRHMMVNSKYNWNLVSEFVRWSQKRLPLTATMLFSALDAEYQDYLGDHFTLSLATKFSLEAIGEPSLKTAARMLNQLSRHLAVKKDAKITPWHRACEVFAAVVVKLNKEYPFMIEMDAEVKRAVNRWLPELETYSSRFPQFLALENNLTTCFIHHEGDAIRVDEGLMGRLNDRFDAMIADTDKKLHLGSNLVAVIGNANTLLEKANEASDAYRYESHVRRPEKAVALVLATLEAPSKLLRPSFLAVGSAGNRYIAFRDLTRECAALHTNLLRLGCSPEQLKAGYTNLFATAVSVFGNVTFKKDVGLDRQHDLLNQLFPHVDFAEVQKKATPGGKSIFANYIRVNHPDRVKDLTLKQLGQVFSQDLGL
ncbi:hypothetical protein [Pseudomonas serbica]|uniref:hypothetical protein n=1 Tax=Pseudomonas serbica TaxID=2965074 RepID=UPI00237BC97D|nr:hypothetical protein [Pseudomonas serbica]